MKMEERLLKISDQNIINISYSCESLLKLIDSLYLHQSQIIFVEWSKNLLEILSQLTKNKWKCQAKTSFIFVSQHLLYELLVKLLIIFLHFLNDFLNNV